MKVIFFGNGPLAGRVLDLLIQSDQVVAVVLHPENRAKQRDELLRLAQAADAVIINAESLRTPEGLQTISLLRSDMGVSTMFGYILRQELLDAFPKGCINLHPAYLPYNRGAHPNVWPLVDGSPAGVTLHQIDAGVDTGAILAQRLVPTLPDDTAQSLYSRLMKAGYELFAASWPGVRSGGLLSQPQTGAGSSHRVTDLKSLDVIDLDAPTTARKVINQLRARTFPPYPGAYLVAEDGRKVFVRVELTPEE
jgi:methionyl-tRNA formyltransferase